jgi:predicted Zn-dependent protease
MPDGLLLLEKLIQKNEYSEALRLCDELLIDNKDSIDILTTKTSIYRKMQEKHLAYCNAKITLNLCPNEPVAYFDLAELLVRLGSYEEAVSIALEGVKVGQMHSFTYYQNVFWLLIAESKFRMGYYNECLEACDNCPDNTVFWIGDRVTGKAILEKDVAQITATFAGKRNN